MTGTDKSAKEQLIIRMFDMLKEQGMYVREDTTLTDKEKLEQADTILNIMKFLKDYDENIEVLDKYWREKHHREKFETGISKIIKEPIDENDR